MPMPVRQREEASRPGRFEVGGRKYLRAPVPVHFPAEEKVPESAAHQWRREVLADSAREAFRDRALVASDQFLYWDPTDPRRCLAPDLALRLGSRHERIATWKVWERGAPDVAVEIVSDSDRPQPSWEAKLERYRCAGVRELVRFDPRNREEPLRVWDLVDGDLVERDIEGSRGESTVLGLWWVIQEHEPDGPLLRLARDREGRELLPTALEREQRARLSAEARLAELEAELRRREP